MATAPRPRRTVQRPRKPPEPGSQAYTESYGPRTPAVGLPFAVNRYRVLFSDGVTVDFLSYSDHSGIRGEMLAQHYGKVPRDKEHLNRIEGIAHLGQEYVYTPCTPPGAPVDT
jgi:hypothetical protein